MQPLRGALKLVFNFIPRHRLNLASFKLINSLLCKGGPRRINILVVLGFKTRYQTMGKQSPIICRENLCLFNNLLKLHLWVPHHAFQLLGKV